MPSRAEPEAAAGVPERPRRVVIIGAGPRGLHALEALAERARSGPAARRLDVTVMDPAPRPGTGSAYAIDQPPWLRLNVDRAVLADSAAGSDGFVAWARREAPELADDPYPPRALVGRCLADRWDAAVARASFPVRIVRARAVDILPLTRGTWEVRSADGDALPADEVLIASGHARDHAGAMHRTWREALPLVPAVLPVDTMLSPARVPAGARVALRGGALTFLDAALTLTAGRGARFEPADSPAGLVHRRSADEPAVLLPITRSGVFLDAKPDPGAALTARGQRALDAARARIAAIAGGADPDRVVEEVLGTVTAAAGDVLLSVPASRRRAVGGERAAVAATLRRGIEPDVADGPGRAETVLVRSLEAASGHRMGPAWALGRAWSGLYPQVVATMRGSEAAPEAFRCFRRAAATLERFTFGPPLRTARALAAMIASGAVDPSWMDAGVRIDDDGITGLPAGAVPPDLVVDAVIAPPGVDGIIDPLLGSLRSRGVLATRPGRRGVQADVDAAVLDHRSQRVPGLSIVGRACEDHIIGHDTVSRRLHGEVEAWARRVVASGPRG